MGYYSEYLERNLSFQDLTAERKVQLSRISELRGGRDVLVFAADLNKGGNVPISISFADLLPVRDQLSTPSSEALDLILETPGGSGEATDDLVRFLRGTYREVGVIVPGWAKSAGTLIAMAADEILMEPSSALGPIDAQIGWQGKVFSAGELLDGLDKIKDEVQTTGILNKAYIPILQGISPGELQRAENARGFAKVLVADWLARFKFKDWDVHRSTGLPVTEEDRRQRAAEIADQLGDHRRWLTHGRSIKLADLESMKLGVTDYSTNLPLSEAIRRYYTLLQMTFASAVYKVFETPRTQILRFQAPGVPPPTTERSPGFAVVEVRCPKCGRSDRLQANLEPNQSLQGGHLPFPVDGQFACPNCGLTQDLSEGRRQVEVQTRKRILP